MCLLDWICHDFDHCSKRCLSHQTPHHVSIFPHLHTLNECPSISSMPSISSILIPSKSQLGHRFPIFSPFFTAFPMPRWRHWTTRPTSWTWRDRPRSWRSSWAIWARCCWSSRCSSCCRILVRRCGDGLMGKWWKMVRNSRNGGIKFYFSSSIRLPFWISMRGGTGWNWGRRRDENGGKVQQTFWIWGKARRENEVGIVHQWTWHSFLGKKNELKLRWYKLNLTGKVGMRMVWGIYNDIQWHTMTYKIHL